MGNGATKESILDANTPASAINETKFEVTTKTAALANHLLLECGEVMFRGKLREKSSGLCNCAI